MEIADQPLVSARLAARFTQGTLNGEERCRVDLETPPPRACRRDIGGNDEARQTNDASRRMADQQAATLFRKEGNGRRADIVKQGLVGIE